MSSQFQVKESKYSKESMMQFKNGTDRLNPGVMATLKFYDLLANESLDSNTLFFFKTLSPYPHLPPLNPIRIPLSPILQTDQPLFMNNSHSYFSHDLILCSPPLNKENVSYSPLQPPKRPVPIPKYNIQPEPIQHKASQYSPPKKTIPFHLTSPPKPSELPLPSTSLTQSRPQIPPLKLSSSVSDVGVLDEHRLEQRQKQIDYGYRTLGYLRYRILVPKEKRKRDCPRTPKKSQLCSKRSWDGQVKKWRRDLHMWDPEEESTFKSLIDQDLLENLMNGEGNVSEIIGEILNSTSSFEVLTNEKTPERISSIDISWNKSGARMLVF